MHVDWLTEWGTFRARPHFLLFLFLSLSLSLTGEQGAHTLFTGQREREREGGGGR